MGGELELTIVYGFKEQNYEYVRNVRKYGVSLYADANIGQNIVYGILCQYRINRCPPTLGNLMRISENYKNSTDESIIGKIAVMDKLAELRGEKADWMVVLFGEWETEQDTLERLVEEVDFSDYGKLDRDVKDYDPWFVQKKIELDNIYGALDDLLFS